MRRKYEARLTGILHVAGFEMLLGMLLQISNEGTNYGGGGN